MSDPRRVREDAGITQNEMAVRARCAINTVAKYEANPNAVTPTKRRDLEIEYARLPLQNARLRNF